MKKFVVIKSKMFDGWTFQKLDDFEEHIKYVIQKMLETIFSKNGFTIYSMIEKNKNGLSIDFIFEFNDEYEKKTRINLFDLLKIFAEEERKNTKLIVSELKKIIEKLEKHEMKMERIYYQDKPEEK
jgi:hypothetical protein